MADMLSSWRTRIKLWLIIQRTEFFNI
jgi:hypothetical protein